MAELAAPGCCRCVTCDLPTVASTTKAFKTHKVPGGVCDQRVAAALQAREASTGAKGPGPWMRQPSPSPSSLAADAPTSPEPLMMQLEMDADELFTDVPLPTSHAGVLLLWSDDTFCAWALALSCDDFTH